jgi:hypothetical protein
LYNNNLIKFDKSISLIKWFWKELDIANNKNYRTLYSFMKNGTYQSGTEELIELSSEPDKMRSFLLIGVLIDQMMYTHTYVVYDEFERVFKYPKINAEYGEGMTGPNWVISEYHGHNKKVNWNTTEEISKFLFGDLYKWLKKYPNEYPFESFNTQIKSTVRKYFDSCNYIKLLPIIEATFKEQ